MTLPREGWVLPPGLLRPLLPGGGELTGPGAAVAGWRAAAADGPRGARAAVGGGRRAALLPLHAPAPAGRSIRVTPGGDKGGGLIYANPGHCGNLRGFQGSRVSGLDPSRSVFLNMPPSSHFPLPISRERRGVPPQLILLTEATGGPRHIFTGHRKKRGLLASRRTNTNQSE